MSRAVEVHFLAQNCDVAGNGVWVFAWKAPKTLKIAVVKCACRSLFVIVSGQMPNGSDLRTSLVRSLRVEIFIWNESSGCPQDLVRVPSLVCL